ncbi:MAG: CDP-glycerol glycerophosphotransferase family protein [Clostridium sp.]
MWRILTTLIIGIIKIISYMLFWVKVDSRLITYISYKSNEIPRNFKLISKNINNKEIKEKFLISKFENNFKGKIKYFLEVIKQIYYIRRSKVVIIDSNNITVSNVKKKETKVIQIWHACGAIKKFGNDYKRKYKIENYDYIITASSKNKKSFSSAFGVNEEQIKVLGYPSCDYMFNKKTVEKYKSQMIKKIGNSYKKIVLYAPTFRGEAIYNMRDVNINLNQISAQLGEKYLIIYKGHPLISKRSLKGNQIIDLSNENIYKLFAVADVLISDFSSVIYEFAVLEKPIICHVPDLNEYEVERGLYCDYKKFAPGKITYNEKELIDCILNEEFEEEKMKKLRENFFDYKDAKSSKRIADFIENIINEK